MDIGQRIRMYRERKGLSRKELAEMSGVAEISIAQYELGKRQPRIEQIKKIAQALQIDPYILITAQDYPKEYYEKWLEYADPIFKYLYSLGYTYELEKEELIILEGHKSEKGTGNIFLVSEQFGKVRFSMQEFEQFKLDLKNTVDFHIWQKSNSFKND